MVPLTVALSQETHPSDQPTSNATPWTHYRFGSEKPSGGSIASRLKSSRSFSGALCTLEFREFISDCNFCNYPFNHLQAYQTKQRANKPKAKGGEMIE